MHNPAPFRDRAVAVLLGATVADAACKLCLCVVFHSSNLCTGLPLHWVYDVAKLKQIVSEDPPEFHVPVANPFYLRGKVLLARCATFFIF
jgi:hypothetical protein